MKNCLIVMTGGALGSLLRYLAGLLAAGVGQKAVWATLFVNVTGSFVIGFASALGGGGEPASPFGDLRLFVVVGLCGGYTTFSAFSLQTVELLRTGETARALVNVILSLVLCFLAVGLGAAAASALRGGLGVRS